MIQQPPRATTTDPRFPYTALVRTHRNGVDPHGFRVRLRAVGRVTLVPALEVLRLAKSAPDQVVHRHRYQQVQRGRVQGAQQLFDRVFPHRGRIAEGGVGDWGSGIRGTKQGGLASSPVIPARMQIGSLAQAPASRSEERRVGKECVSTWRTRGSPELLKKKKK